MHSTCTVWWAVTAERTWLKSLTCPSQTKKTILYESKLSDTIIYTFPAQTFSRDVYVINMTVAIHFKACYCGKNA